MNRRCFLGRDPKAVKVNEGFLIKNIYDVS